MSWQEVKRGRNIKLFQNSGDPAKFSLDAGLVRLHYSTEYGAETYENEIDFNPERITVGGYDGWRVQAAPWNYFLGEYPNNLGDGWVGFGGRRGQHALWFRLLRVGFMRWSDRDWWDIGGAPTYDRANLTRTVTTTTLPTTGESIPTGLIAKWSNLWATPGEGAIGAEWRADGNRLKEEITLNQAGRTWIKNNRNPLTHWPGESLDNLYFGFVFALDPSDIPRWVKQGIVQDIEGDFDDDGGQSGITLENALQEYLAFLPVDDAIVRGVEEGGRIIDKRLRLRKRIYVEGENYYLLVGARADLLNDMPDGVLIFDPTVEESPQAGGDDYYGSTVPGDIDTGTDSVVIGYEDGWTGVYSGIRFPTVAITEGATIDTGYVNCDAFESDSSTTCNVSIWAVDEATPAAATTNGEVSTDVGLSTTATVAWSSIAAWTAGTNYNTADIKTIIQELLDSYGATFGAGTANVLLYFWDNSSSANAERRISTYGNYKGYDAALLHVEYTTSSPVSINLDTASASASGQALAIVPGAVSKALDTALLTAGGQSLTVTPGAISISLTTAITQALGQSAGIVPGAASIALTSAGITANGQAISLDLGAVSVALSTALLDAIGQAATIVPGAREISLTTAILTATGEAIEVTIGYIIALDTATVIANGQALTVIPGVVSTALQTATILADGVSITVVPGAVSKALQTAAISAGGQAISIQPGAVIIGMNTASIQADGQSIGFTMGGVSVLLDSAAILAGGQSITVSAISDIIATVRAWSLRDRDIGWTLLNRDGWTLKERDTDWSVDDR